MSNISIDVNRQLENVAKEAPRPFERYLPEGYPQLLFQGTSIENANMIRESGLASGTLSTWIFDCFDARFYRKVGGRLLVSAYSSQTYMTDDLGSKQSPYQYFSIKPDTGPRRKISYSSIDTDGQSRGQKEMYSTEYVDPQSLASLAFDEEQRAFLDLVSSIFSSWDILGSFPPQEIAKVAAMLRSNNLPDSAAGVAGAGVTFQMESEAGLGSSASLDYRSFVKQRQLALVLGLEIADFSTFQSFQEAIRAHFLDEDALINQIVHAFPGNLTWDWKNLKLSDEEILEAIIRQMYQKEVIDNTKSLFLNEPMKPRIELNGKSITGLQKIKAEKGIG